MAPEDGLGSVSKKPKGPLWQPNKIKNVSLSKFTRDK
jgi:hypothetical protein